MSSGLIRRVGKLIGLGLSLLAAAATCPLHAAAASASGQQVIVIYNSRLPESKALAEYYAQKRRVPTSQVFGFALTTNDTMTRSEYRDVLETPLAKALEDKKLWHVGSVLLPAVGTKPGGFEWRPVESKIRYAVLCYGMPLRVANDPNLREQASETTRSEFRVNGAAVDSELALLPLIQNNLPLTGVFRNPAYLATNTARLHPTNGVLMVTRLDGPSVAIARGLVDKALEAETNGLWGRAYFDLRNTPEPALKMGDDWIRNASEICRHLGFETLVDTNSETFPAGFPMSQIAYYVGWYSAEVCGPFAQPSVEFVPGAFAYHLHSFSASTLHSRTASWAGPLLAKGVTATMGTVDEPYINFTPDMQTFTSLFIYHGFTFGEAACASQPALSWHTTIVGDPLYQPFGRNPERVFDEMVRNQSPLLEWAYLRLVDLSVVNGRPAAAAVAFLEQLALAKRSAVLSEKLGDLYQAQGKPSSAVEQWSKALNLGPSPQQRIRLRLTLGEHLAAMGREPEALEDFRELLDEVPRYPDKTLIIRKLLALAQKLDRKADAEKYQAELKSLSN